MNYFLNNTILGHINVLTNITISYQEKKNNLRLFNKRFTHVSEII